MPVILVLTISGCTTIETFRANYQDLRKGIVEILADGHLEGSGWIATADGKVVTAAHVVWHAKDIEIVTAENRRLKCELIAIDAGNDLALLKPLDKSGNCPFLKLSSNEPEPGENVFLMGSPLYRHRLLLPGVVSSKTTVYEFNPVFNDYVEVYHFAANTPGGTSGGCWVDRAGRVIGVQSGMMTIGNSMQGVAFVSPISAVKQLIEKSASDITPTIDCVVEELWEQPKDFIKKVSDVTNCVVVVRLNPNGSAEKSGLKKNDLILKVNNRPIATRDDFIRTIRGATVGQTVNVEVLRYDTKERLSFDVRVTSVEEKRFAKPN